MRFSVLLLGIVALSVVTAQDHDHDHDHAGVMKHPKRTLRFTKHGNTKYSITGKSRENGIKSMMKFTCSVNGFPNFRLSFFKKEDNNVEGFSFRVGLLKLAEYNATVPANETTNSYSLRGKRSLWTPPVKETLWEDGDDKVYRLSSNMTGTGDFSAMTLSFQLLLATKNLTYENVTLGPNQIKYGLTVLNFPYQLENSSLAFLTGVIVPSVSNREYGNVTVNIGNNATFEWVPEAIADNVPTPIEANRDMFTPPITNTSSPDDADDDSRSTEEIDFIYYLVKDVVHPANVTWDPTLGFDDSEMVMDGTDSSAAPSMHTTGSGLTSLLFPVVLTYLFLLA